MRAQETLLLRAIGSWGVWCHLILCIATSILMLSKLDGYDAADDSRVPFLRWRNGLRVSDVATLISVANTLIRICSTSVVAISSARVIFMLLEKASLSLGEVQSIASWKAIIRLPFRRRRYEVAGEDKTNQSSLNRSGLLSTDSQVAGNYNHRRWVWSLALILLLMTPQQFSAPILSGSVDWNVFSTWGQPVKTFSGSQGEIELDWASYADDGRLREWHARRASGYAGITWGSSNGADAPPGPEVCRHIIDNRGLPEQSKLLGATLPHIKVHSINWDPPNVTRSSLPLGPNISSFGDDVLRYYQTGNAVLYDPQNSWAIPTAERVCVARPQGIAAVDAAQAKSQAASYGQGLGSAIVRALAADSGSAQANSGRPAAQDGTSLTTGSTQQCSEQLPAPKEPLRFVGEAMIAVLISRQNITECQTIRNNSFGDTSRVRKFANVTLGVQESCYALGTVNFTAGVVTLPETRYISSQVVEGNCTDAILDEGTWVREALLMMPDVMTMVSLMNATSMPTWDALDEYVGTLLQQSFTASWDALYSASNLTVFLDAQPYQPRIRASVSRLRVAVWLALNLLLTVSTLFLLFAESFCERGTAYDATAAFLMTDVDASLLGNERDNLSMVTGVDSNVRVKLLRNSSGRFRLSPHEWKR
ncbi:hypothetical protein B0T26DRAFT_751019 [Lasiosphaeria miniovina]|uniref:Uncharacterized protein n=1 Tax=Lasiosphaeria miniovina TaxID=1954250 RepID=A0AA40AJA4_9PEZI|nr:uncharacterized protein B0T26DRAFT_751019 [Lasiosphaeria miniovina]KAK0716874.1 hypothetical protein B0T26DRAFT_751019 [Lasiosphaeria miniovina]